MLGEAVKSVLAQSYPHWELLVVDDGSTDGTRALVEGFADPRIRYLRNDDAGAASARNLGIARAAGSLLAYLDSDNRWTPEFLETMVGYVLSSGLDLAYCGMRLESEEGVRFRGRPFDYADLVRVNYIDLNAILHRRELVDQSGVFDTSLRRMIDWDLLLRYAKDAKVGYAPFIGVLYDEFKRYDRITVKESISWKFVVLNRYLIDWQRLRAEAAGRDRNLVSIVIPVYGKFGITNDCLESLYQVSGEAAVRDCSRQQPERSGDAREPDALGGGAEQRQGRGRVDELQLRAGLQRRVRREPRRDGRVSQQRHARDAGLAGSARRRARGRRGGGPAQTSLPGRHGAVGRAPSFPMPGRSRTCSIAESRATRRTSIAPAAFRRCMAPVSLSSPKTSPASRASTRTSSTDRRTSTSACG